MALIKCEECEREVSDQAATCPNCGANPRVHSINAAAIAAARRKNTGCLVVIACAAAFLLAFCWRATKPVETWEAVGTAPPPAVDKSAEPSTEKLAEYAKELEDESMSADARGGRAQWIVKNFPDSAEAKRANELLPVFEEQAKQERIGRQWYYGSSDDGMSEKKVHYARVESTNSFEFGFPYQGAQHARLTVRRHPRWGNDVIFTIERGQILCHSFSGCPVKVRFDDGPVQTYQGNEPEDNSSDTVFIPGHAGFVSKLGKAKKLRIEVNVYHEGTLTAEFNVEGFNPDRAAGKK